MSRPRHDSVTAAAPKQIAEPCRPPLPGTRTVGRAIRRRARGPSVWMTTRPTMPARGESPATLALRLCNGGEVQQDCGAAAQLALGLYATAMCLDEMLNDRQPEPRAAFLTRATGVHTVEPLENAGEVLGGDAAARIAHPDDDVVPRALRGHADATTGRRMTHRVIKQIREDLLQRFGIAADSRAVRRSFELHAPVSCPLGEPPPRLARSGFHPDRARLRLPFADTIVDNARRMQRLVDDL